MNPEPAYKIVEAIENGNTVLKVFSQDSSWFQGEFWKSFLGGLCGFIFAVALWWLSKHFENRKEKKNLMTLIKYEILNNLSMLNTVCATEERFNDINIKTIEFLIKTLTINCYEKLFDKLAMLQPQFLKDILAFYDSIELLRAVGMDTIKNDGSVKDEYLQWLVLTLYKHIETIYTKNKQYKELKKELTPFIEKKIFAIKLKNI